MRCHKNQMSLDNFPIDTKHKPTNVGRIALEQEGREKLPLRDSSHWPPDA